MKNEIVPDLPKFQDSEIKNDNDLALIMSEFAESQNRFIFYENRQGEIKLFFDKLDSPLYCCMAVKLSQPEYHKVYEFFKLVLEAVYQEKKITKKGHEVACRIETQF